MLFDVWAISTLMLVIVMWFYGLIPALWRLGNGLVRKKIVIYAKGDNASDLEKLVKDLKIFKGEIAISRSENSFGDGEDADIHIIRWIDFKSFLKEILQKKKKNSSLIVYCPKSDGFVDDESMNIINSKENAVLVQFRGRLLNDIIISLITTSYEKR